MTWVRSDLGELGDLEDMGDKGKTKSLGSSWLLLPLGSFGTLIN